MVPKIRGVPLSASKRRASGGGGGLPPEAGIKKLGKRKGAAVEEAASAATAAVADALDVHTGNGSAKKRTTRNNKEARPESQTPIGNKTKRKLRSSTGGGSESEAAAAAEAAKAVTSAEPEAEAEAETEAVEAVARTPKRGKKSQSQSRGPDHTKTPPVPAPAPASSKKQKAGERKAAGKKSSGRSDDEAPASSNKRAASHECESPPAASSAARADGDADADDAEKPITTFAMGDLVEVRYQEEGFYGSWQAGKICGVKPGLRQVEFRMLMGGNRKNLLKEWVQFGKEPVSGKLPPGAKLIKDGRPLLRPAGPGSPPRKPSFRKTGGWPKNLWVEVFYNDAWWEGALLEDISATQMPQKESVVNVYYPELDVEEEVTLKHIRECKDWDEDTGLWKIRGKRQ